MLIVDVVLTTLCLLGSYALLPATGKLWVYARTAEAISEACLRKVFGKYESPEGKTLKVTVLGVLAEDVEADKERPEVNLLMSAFPFACRPACQNLAVKLQLSWKQMFAKESLFDPQILCIAGGRGLERDAAVGVAPLRAAGVRQV